MTSQKGYCLLAFAFFESSILLKMSFAWDSRAAKLEAFRGSEDSLNFFAFFFPLSLTFGVFGTFGIFGGFRALWALVDLEVFCLAFARLCDSTWAGETGSSGSEWVDGGCSTGSKGLTMGSFFTALFAFCKDKSPTDSRSSRKSNDRDQPTFHQNSITPENATQKVYY